MRFSFSVFILIFAAGTLFGERAIRSDSGPEQKTELSSAKLSPEGVKKARAMTEFFLFLNEALNSPNGKLPDKQFAHLLNAIEADPDSAELLAYATGSLKNDPKLRKARLDSLAEIAEKKPEAFLLNIIAATFYGDMEDRTMPELRNLPKAISLLENSLKCAEEKGTANDFCAIGNILSMIYFYAKDYEKADELLKEEFKIVPENRRDDLFRSALRIYRGAMEDASDEKPFPFGWFADSPKERYAKSYRKTLDRFSAYLKEPGRKFNMDTLYPLTEILRKEGKEDLALLIPSLPLFSDPQDISALRRLALYYHFNKDYANSVRVWDEIFALKKGREPNECIMYARALLIEDPGKAYRTLLFLRKHFPRYPIPPNFFAAAAYFAEKYEDVVKFVNRFRDPTPHMLEFKAASEANLGNFSAAADTMLKYLSKIRKIVDPKFYRTKVLQAVQYAEKAKKYDIVGEILRPMIAENPGEAEWLNMLGYIYANAGIRLDESEELLKKALGVEPDNYAFLDSMAWVLYRKKDFKGAWEYIAKSIEQMKKRNAEVDGVILDHAGDIAMKLGRKRDAVSYWKASLGIYSEETSRKDILEKLKNAER